VVQVIFSLISQQFYYFIHNCNGFEFTEKDYFLGDPEEIRKLMEAVANQGKKK